MARYKGLLKLYKFQNTFFQTHRSSHHLQVSCHVSSSREYPATPNRILDAPHFPSAGVWIFPQPNHNIWVTLAKTLQHDNLCLSMGCMDNPLSMYLVGVPLAANEYPYDDKKPNPVDTWDK